MLESISGVGSTEATESGPWKASSLSTSPRVTCTNSHGHHRAHDERKPQRKEEEAKNATAGVHPVTHAVAMAILISREHEKSMSYKILSQSVKIYT